MNNSVPYGPSPGPTKPVNTLLLAGLEVLAYLMPLKPSLVLE